MVLVLLARVVTVERQKAGDIRAIIPPMTPKHTHPILYTQAGCAESRRVRDWLAARGAPLVERDATADLEAARALYATGTFATPLLVAGDVAVLEFQPLAIADALGVQDDSLEATF